MERTLNSFLVRVQLFSTQKLTISSVVFPVKKPCALWYQGVLKDVYSFTNDRHVDRYDQLGTAEEEGKIQKARRVCATVVPASHHTVSACLSWRGMFKDDLSWISHHLWTSACLLFGDTKRKNQCVPVFCHALSCMHVSHTEPNKPSLCCFIILPAVLSYRMDLFIGEIMGVSMCLHGDLGRAASKRTGTTESNREVQGLRVIQEALLLYPNCLLSWM